MVQIYAQNASEYIWWPRSARTRWGSSLCAPRDLVAAMGVGRTTSKGTELRERRREGTERERKGIPPKVKVSRINTGLVTAEA